MRRAAAANGGTDGTAANGAADAAALPPGEPFRLEECLFAAPLKGPALQPEARPRAATAALRQSAPSAEGFVGSAELAAEYRKVCV